jgi:lauroyl/myristoyl acyltransferase
VPTLQDSRIALHVVERPARSPDLWSRDDTKFMIAAPLLFGAALLCPRRRWHQVARLIEWTSGRVPSVPDSIPLLATAARLGTTMDELQRIMALSRINRTEHLIHVFHSLMRKDPCPEFEIFGMQHLDAALEEGKGAVLWVAHFSFASLYTKMALSRAGYRVSHISRPEHGVSKSRFGIKYLNRFRCAAENRYLQHRIVHLRDKPEATREAALAALGRNELLSITIGAWEGRHFASGELLGSRYKVSTGAPALAFAAAAPLLPVFTTRDDRTGQYDVAVGAPLGKSARSTREDFVHASMLELFGRYEAAIKKAPSQWRGWSALTA